MRPQAVLAAVFGAARAAAADPPLPSPANLDGIYVNIGPVGAASRIEGEWFSAFGLELSVVQVTETRLPAVFGLAAGGVSYAGRDGGRLWLEAETALGYPLPIGIGVGAAAEVDRVRPVRLGIESTIWIYEVLVPYLRVGTVRETGSFVELGVMVKIPARRFP